MSQTFIIAFTARRHRSQRVAEKGLRKCLSPPPPHDIPAQMMELPVPMPPSLLMLPQTITPTMEGQWLRNCLSPMPIPTRREH